MSFLSVPEDPPDAETAFTASTAAKESTINSYVSTMYSKTNNYSSTMYSYGAPPTLPRDGRDDDEDEFEDGSFTEDGSFIEDGSFTEDASFFEDGSSVATNDSYWEYAVNGFTKKYQEFTKAINKFDEKTHQEFTKAINKFDESAAIKCEETADTIVDTARKFPKEHRDVRPLRDAYDKSGRSGVTNATGYTTATNVTEATGKTACTTKSGRSGVTEANATNATGLTGPTRERPEKYTSIEVVYNSEVDRTLGPQVTKKTRECERSVPSNSSKKSRATQRSGTNATGLTGPTRERPEKYPAIEVVYNNQADRTKGPQVTKKTRECPPHERSKLSNVPDEVPSHGGEDNSIFGGDATQRSSILPIASPERVSLGDLEPSDQLSNVSAKRRASVLKPSDLTLDRSLAQTIPSDLTITGRPGRDESYFTSRFGVTWGNAEKAAAPIAENIPIL